LMLVNGVSKHTWLGRYAVAGLRVHIDSLREAQQLVPQAVAQGWRIGLRCHVPLEGDGSDPGFGGQFGLSAEEASSVCALLRANGLEVQGIHFHLGHGACSPNAYTNSVKYVANVCLQNGLTPRYIDFGGGLDAVSPAVDDLERAINWAHDRFPASEAWTENGRFLTHLSTALVTRIVDVKHRAECRYLLCDGGRTNQALAADRGIHPMLVVPRRAGPMVLTTVVGPTCMTDDRLGRVMLPEAAGPGDLIVWLRAGAYHLPWETRFSQGLCAVVWCDGSDVLSVARARENPVEWGRLWTAQN
jgi:ornithine decarboxylase